MSPSGALRTRIGQETARLNLYINSYNNNTPSFELDLKDQDDDFILKTDKLLHKIAQAITRLISTIESLDDKWIALQATNTAEQAEYARYIDVYGDYHLPLQTAYNIQENIETYLDKFDREYQIRCQNENNQDDTMRNIPEVENATFDIPRNNTPTTPPITPLTDSTIPLLPSTDPVLPSVIPSCFDSCQPYPNSHFFW